MAWTSAEASGTWPHPWGYLRPLGFFEWTKIVRRTKLPTATKAVALILGTYADTKTGYKVRPGQARIAREAGMTDRSVRTHLRELERLGLIYCTERGSNIGTAGAASHYVLTALADLVEEIEATPDTRIIDLGSPDHRKPASAAPVDNSDDHRKPASAGSGEPPEIRDTTTGNLEQTTGNLERDHRKPASAYLHKTSHSSLQTTSPALSPEAMYSPVGMDAELVLDDQPAPWDQPASRGWGSIGSPAPAKPTTGRCNDCGRGNIPKDQLHRVIDAVGLICEPCIETNGWRAA